MKVAIEARALTNQGGGVNRYVKNLLTNLPGTSDQLTCYTVVDAPIRLGRPLRQTVMVKRYGDIGLGYWLNYQLEKKLQSLNIDVVHYTKADVPRRKRRPTVVTIYDVIPLLLPQGQKWTRRWYWPMALKRAALNSDHIMTISEASKKDICEKLKVEPAKVTVTRLSVEDKLLDYDGMKTPSVRPYILFVGTIEPRKNIGGLLKSFAKISAQIPHRLVVAGKPYHGGQEYLALSRSLGLEDRVEWRGFVSEEELKQLYGQADLFVWPSVYEGWGFPPQEAMAYGVPVVVSNGGSLPEVVGEAGEIVNFSTDNIYKRLNDEAFVENFGQRMLMVLQDKSKQAVMQERGKKQATTNSWEMVANKTMEIYKMVNG